MDLQNEIDNCIAELEKLKMELIIFKKKFDKLPEIIEVENKVKLRSKSGIEYVVFHNEKDKLIMSKKRINKY